MCVKKYKKFIFFYLYKEYKLFFLLILSQQQNYFSFFPNPQN